MTSAQMTTIDPPANWRELELANGRTKYVPREMKPRRWPTNQSDLEQVKGERTAAIASWFKFHYPRPISLDDLLTPMPPLPALLQQRLSEVPRQAGVYVFWRFEQPLYVGEAISLRARLRSHLALCSTNQHLRLWLLLDRFETCSFSIHSVLETAGKLNRLAAESDAIRELQPLFN